MSLTETAQATPSRAEPDRTALIEVAKVREVVPWWPYSTQGTYRLIRAGRLGCVAIGRRRYVTRELLDACVDEHTVHLRARHDELEAQARAVVTTTEDAKR